MYVCMHINPTPLLRRGRRARRRTGGRRTGRTARTARRFTFFFSVLLSSLQLSDTKVFDPQIPALLGTAAHFRKVVVLKKKRRTCRGHLTGRISQDFYLKPKARIWP